MSPIVTALIPVIVPIIVSQIKKLTLPKWLLPVASVFLGAAIEITAQLGGGQPISMTTPVDGGMLGLAGVGVREVFDQIFKKK